MIQLLIDGRNFGKKGAGICVKMLYERFEWIRTFLCDKITSNQAELKAIEFALKSICDGHDGPILIRTSGRYATMMLERTDGEWTKKAKSNKGLLEAVREQFSRFKDIQIEVSADLGDLKVYNEQTVKTKTEIDQRGP